MTKVELEQFIKKQVAQECGIAYDEIDPHKEFYEFGMDSMQSIMIMERLEKFLKTELSPLYFWDNPTIETFTDFIFKEIIPKKEN